MNTNSRWPERCFTVSSLQHSRTSSCRLSVCFYCFFSLIEQLILHCTQNDEGRGQTTNNKKKKMWKIPFAFLKDLPCPQNRQERPFPLSSSPTACSASHVVQKLLYRTLAMEMHGLKNARKKSLDYSSYEARASDLTMMLRAEYYFDTTHQWESQGNPNAPSWNQTIDLLPLF